MNSTKNAHELQKKNSRDEQEGMEGKGSDSKLLIQDATAGNFDHQEVHHGPSSKIWTFRYSGVRNSPTSGKMSVKWRA